MNNWKDGDETPSSEKHIYINGYGFVSEDPWLQEHRSIWKSASLVGVVLIAILTLPVLLFYPIRFILNILFSPFFYMTNETYAVAHLKIFYMQLESLLTYMGTMLLPLGFAALVFRPKGRRHRMFRQPVPHSMGICVTSGMALWVIFYLAGRFMSSQLLKIHLLSLSPDTSLPMTFSATILYVLRLVILPAFLEETLFRGYILRYLRRFGDTFAIIASSAAFGMIHYTLAKDIRNFALGLLLSYFVIRSESLWPAILTRFCCLLLGTSVDFLPQIFPGSAAGLIQNLLFLVVLAAGIIWFVLFCRKESNFFTLNGSNTSMSVSQKLLRFFGNLILLAACIFWLIQAVEYFQIIG